VTFEKKAFKKVLTIRNQIPDNIEISQENDLFESFVK
jgi:hypothetical protein